MKRIKITEAWIPYSGGKQVVDLRGSRVRLIIAPSETSALWWAGWWSDWTKPAAAKQISIAELKVLELHPAMEIVFASDEAQDALIMQAMTEAGGPQ